MTCDSFQNAIAYYRVSTAKQGNSGLGLNAQRSSVEAFAAGQCLEIVSEYVEVETGTNKRERPQLAAAIRAAREQDAVLLIAKLDRLARNVHFISGLLESGVKFVAVDMPEVDNLTIHILAAVAEKEAKLISERTKAALDAKREKEGEWRVSNLDDEARQAGAETNKQRALDAYKSAAFTANLLRQGGASYRDIAQQLNENGYKTRRGKTFKAMTVKRMLDREEQAST